MLQRSLFFLWIFPFILFLDIANAQDLTNSRTSTSIAVDFYSKFIGEDSHLYNGSEHAPYDFRIRGDAYFESNLLTKGFIKYDEVLYPMVNMAYDIVRDEVTTNRYNENFRIKLVSEKIAYFSVFNHYFTRLVHDSINKSFITTGFYDVLHDGKIKFLSRRQKKIMEKVTADEGDQLWFEENDLFIVQKEGNYYQIKDKSELFNLFKDRKKELKRYLRKSKIKFNKNPEYAILKTVEYFDQSKN
jgi:hypothetical protein